MDSRISVVLGTDLPQVSRQVSAYLKSARDLHLVATATNEAGVLQLAKHHRPHVAIVSLSVRQPVLTGVVSALAGDRVCPVVMSDVLEDTEAIELLQCGLVGILPSAIAEDMLCQSVRAIASGEIWIRRNMVGKVIDQIRGTSGVPVMPKVAEKYVLRSKTQSDNQFNLTHRELQIVQATTEGMTNKEIASALDISEFTVKHHLAKIFDKLGVYSRLELATFALHHRLCRRSTAAHVTGSFKAVAPVRGATSTF